MNYIKILCVFLANRSLLTLVIVKHMERNLDTKKPRYSEHILPVPWPFVIQRVALCISQADSLYDGQVITKSYVASLHNFYQEITGFTRKFCSIQPNENCQFLTLFSCFFVFFVSSRNLLPLLFFFSHVSLEICK